MGDGVNDVDTINATMVFKATDNFSKPMMKQEDPADATIAPTELTLQTDRPTTPIRGISLGTMIKRFITSKNKNDVFYVNKGEMSPKPSVLRYLNSNV